MLSLLLSGAALTYQEKRMCSTLPAQPLHRQPHRAPHMPKPPHIFYVLKQQEKVGIYIWPAESERPRSASYRFCDLQEVTEAL